MGKLGLACVLLGVVACGSLEQHRVITGTPRAAQAGEVRVLMENAPLPPSFDEVAIVQSIGTGKQARDDLLLAGLQDQARQLGCNVVARVRIDRGRHSATAVGVAGVVPE
jgi:hypothetical protein